MAAVLLTGLLAGGGWPEGGFHAGDPDVFQAGDALGVDPQQQLDAVPGPGGDLGGRDPGVQPPGDAGVAKVVRAPH